ncbi:Nuclear envelope phosphatase-regulatory subunit 1 [Sarcoptes scabiei]|uniref:Transmembrane protein 188 n=1 Tax=Sarcoptes scabiei TaxID=52283 RepID=A0A834R9H6_SARSC|nr:Nuclear envelope phosphatase-regulatory subunit 1 [Sarcoptes scabiei]UXI18573.1 hypothetical protein NH340_JMT04516 [Sarcoptes scabiei]
MNFSRRSPFESIAYQNENSGWKLNQNSRQRNCVPFKEKISNDENDDQDDFDCDRRNDDDQQTNFDSNPERLSLEQSICEDLLLFEARLVEIIQGLESRTKIWRWTLIISIYMTVITATDWLSDQQTFELTFWQSICNHHWFAINCLILILLFSLFKIHRRIFQHSIVAQRIRNVLGQFNMDCDMKGRLILMPRPSSFFPRTV